MRAAARATRLVAIVVLAASGTSTVLAQEVPPAPMTLVLSNGTVLVGTAVSESGGQIHFRADLVGSVVIDASNVTERRAAPAVAVAPALAAAPASAPAAAATPAAPTGQRVPWVRTLSIGGGYHSAPYLQGSLVGTVSGVTGAQLRLPGTQANLQAELQILRAGTRTSVVATGHYTLADVKPTGRVMDAGSLEVVVTRLVRTNVLLASDSVIARDGVRNIDSMATQSVGIGRRLVTTPRVRWELIAGVGVRRQDQGTAYDNELHLDYGFVEQASITARPGMQLFHSFKLRVIAQHPELYSAKGVLRVTAPITRRIGLMINTDWDYDRMLGLRETVLAPGTFYPGSPQVSFRANRQSSLQVISGLQFTF